MELIVFDKEAGRDISDGDELMILSGQDPRIGFESIAVQEDKTIIICDKCGNFGYLSERYKIHIVIQGQTFA